MNKLDKFNINCCFGCVLFTDVCCVLFLFCLSIFLCVCLQLQGPLRECPQAGRFRASLLLHTTCVRSWCNWHASCVAGKITKK